MSSKIQVEPHWQARDERRWPVQANRRHGADWVADAQRSGWTLRADGSAEGEQMDFNTCHQNCQKLQDMTSGVLSNSPALVCTFRNHDGAREMDYSRFVLL